MNRIHKTPKGTELPLLNLRGRDYLEVKYRLVWFREEHPSWSIETEFISVTDKSACARAVIRDETGRIVATSHKFENERGFPDFMEKAETGAIGRALALIGYGTQFCADELDEGKRIVDAPVARGSDSQARADYASAGSAYQPPYQSQPPAASTDEDGNALVEPEKGQDLGEYLIGFGRKYKGKRLKEIPRAEIESYLQWLEADAQKKNTPLSYPVQLLKKAVDLYHHDERKIPEAS